MKDFLEFNENEMWNTKIMGLNESCANRQVQSSKGPMKNSQLSYTNDLTAHLKGLEQKEYTQ